MTEQQQQYTLPKLPYELDALEPVISAEIMSLHYNKHHAAYVANLNKALEQLTDVMQKHELATQIAIQKAIRFNGGGHVNHSIFWTNLAPIGNGGGGKPEGDLAKAIDHSFGSFEKFVELFNAAAVGLQGSGWAWLGYNKTNGHVEIATCDNQDPLSTKGLVPLLGFDVWEHAYYIQYKNVRADYVKALWQIVNWKNVAERYSNAKSAK